MIATAIYARLTATTAVTALVSDRIYPVKAPQGCDMPYITFRLISQVPENTKDTSNQFDRYRVQIDCIGDDFDDVETLAYVVRNALDRSRGTWAGVTVNTMIYDNTNDLATDFQDDSEQVYGKAVDFIIITT